MSEANNQSEREYNYIYEKLVSDSSDFTGMVAYALYKKEKIDYLKKLKEKNGNISDDDVSNFHIASDVRLESYTKEAVSLTTDFVNDLIDRKVKMSKELITEIVDKKAGPKGFINWSRVITQNIIAAIIYTLGIYILLMFVWFKNSGNENLAKDKLKKSTNHFLQNKNTPYKKDTNTVSNFPFEN